MQRPLDYRRAAKWLREHQKEKELIDIEKGDNCYSDLIELVDWFEAFEVIATDYTKIMINRYLERNKDE